MKKRFKNNFQPRQFLWSYYIFLLLIVIKKVQRHSCKEREEVKRRSLSRRVHAKRARLQFQLSALAENSIRRGSSCFSSNGLISNYRDIYLSKSREIARTEIKARRFLFPSFSDHLLFRRQRKCFSNSSLGKQLKIGIGCKYIFAVCELLFLNVG